MKKITVKQLKKMWIYFFVEKQHKQIKSSSLIPENDGSVLFTTAGMHPLVPYLLGQPHPEGKRLVDIQKCVRTNDIDEVGDNSHCTFFEMLGNWSLGDYFKKEMINNSFEFLTSEKYLGIPLNKLAVTVFAGDENAPRDNESFKFWKANGLKDEQIFFLNKEHNWWAAGETGPCGPDTEMFFVNENVKCDNPNCSPACDCGRYLEIWNDVFMQYVVKTPNSAPELLEQKNVDTGMGLERTVAVLNGYDNVYETEIFKGIIELMEELSGTKKESSIRNFRIIADHMRASTFILGDENPTKPSNVGAGYVLRRLIRRSVNCARAINLSADDLLKIVNKYIEIYKGEYESLNLNKELILTELKKEIDKFGHTINSGLKEFNKVIQNNTNKVIAGDIAFRLYDTFGFPIELTKEMAINEGFKVDMVGFENAFKHHQELSRAGNTQVFKGGLSSSDEIDTRYHTCAHLLLASLREMFGEGVLQRGCNITPERIRFDFNLDRKMTEEEKVELEKRVNDKISTCAEVMREEMTLEEARKSGAMGIFENKYGEKVSVYTIGNISKEICGGPHVKNTREIGKFKLVKEESSSAGIRRVKGIIE